MHQADSAMISIPGTAISKCGVFTASRWQTARKCTVLITKGVETHSKGSVLAAKAVDTRDKVTAITWKIGMRTIEPSAQIE